MRYKFFFGILFLCCFLLPESKTSAQGASSPTPAPANVKLFFEKVYLHFDRSYYTPGEDVWFKAYLVNAQTNALTNSSHNLYVELTDPGGNVVTKETLRLDNGTAAGDLALGDSIPGGAWHIRAYTNWMKNFGSHFVFEKTIWVHVPPAAILSSAPLSSAARDAAYQSAAHTAASASDTRTRRSATAGSASTPDTRTSTPASEAPSPQRPTPDIQFLPEGGAMVEGAAGVVCFKAIDGSGNGVEAKGYILSSKGDTAARFSTEHRGMGRFSFLPAAGLEYTARVSFAGQPYRKTAFPSAFKEGYVMNITPADTAEIIHIATNAATTAHYPSGEVTLAGRQAGKLYYGDKIGLKEGKATVTIPYSYFPTGITAITLYDGQLHPQCERLVYIAEREPVTVTITSDKPVYEPRTRTTIDITVTDAQQHPVKAALSLTATQDIAAGPEQRNILSYLLLESELRGRIEAATEYFDKDNPRRGQQLDLLLATQGWNSFLWRKLADTTIRISYLPEAGFTITGHVRQTLIDHPLANMNITVFVAAAKGDRRYATRTNAGGKYYIDGLQWDGYQAVQINSKDDKGEKGGWLFMDTVFSSPPPLSELSGRMDDDPADRKRFDTEADKKARAPKDVFHSVLPDVTVTNQATKTVQLRDQVATSFGYPEYNFTIAQKDLAMGTLDNFLLHNVPGAMPDVERNGVVFFANGRKVRPRFFVDKKEEVFNRVDYYSIPMDKIIKVSVRHLLGQVKLSANARGANGAEDGRDLFLVYLELRPGALNDDMALIRTKVDGYYEARSFYSPDHLHNDNPGPDTRSTLQWTPDITTDPNGKATVSFYNADRAATIRVNVQGITDKGVPVTATIKYEVK
ncbi:MAG TPA: MG2 domain-containing protein [Puia sp.]|jgi:hypothetical protein